MNYINLISSSPFLSIITVSLLGLALRISLTFCKQSWASTYHHTMTYMLLPVITFIVTKTISGSISLSLGMVGALSIIRFRNPVKNSFELCMYFALITIGITGSVNIKNAILLSGFISLVIIFSYVLEKLSKKWGKSLYSFSFAEGQSANTLELVTHKKINNLFIENNLINEIIDNDLKVYIYKFASSDKNDIINLKNKIDTLDQLIIKSVNVEYNS